MKQVIKDTWYDMIAELRKDPNLDLGMIRKYGIVAMMYANGLRCPLAKLEDYLDAKGCIITFQTQLEMLVGHCSRKDVPNGEKEKLIATFRVNNIEFFKKYWITRSDFDDPELLME